ncbi:MAG: tetratricopeptide repeat protein [Dehalococcoidia bacterium]
MPTTTHFRDRYGLPLSTTSAIAAEQYTEGIDRTLAGSAGADQCLERALAADDGFALAQAALARSEQFRGLIPQARARAARARALASGTTPRERSHVETIAIAIDHGGGPRALAAVKEHVGQFPRDAFVLSQASGVYGLIGFSGRQDRNDEQVALLDSVAPAYGDEDWWFLSAYGFAQNEVFRFEEARRLVERSLQLYDRNAHAAHALGHVFYETGDPGSGAAFLDPWIDAYDRTAQLFGHLSWHLALFELAAGNVDRVSDLFEHNIGPRASKLAPLGILADSASLLWRCDLYGSGAPRSWDDVRDLAVRAFPHTGVTFADVHAGLAYAASGDQESLDRLIAELRGRAAEGRLPAGEGVIALIEGIAAFARADYEAAVRRLEPVADQVIRIGGSHAQREVFEDTLLVAYLRSGRREQAEALLRERLDRRPSTRDARWLAEATVDPSPA